jgi:tetratricopeptide (TPR) repeat protein
VLQIYNEAEVQTYANGMKLHHWPDDSKSRGSYLPLLELAVKEEPNDDRSSHYLGREYMYYELHEKAIAELERHLSLSTALWKAERAASMRFIARCNTGLGRHNEAQAWALKSCVEAPSDREPWYDLAIAAYKAPKQDWHMIRLACNKALEIETRPASYICEQAAWGHELWDYLALASWNLGDKAGAIAAGAKALELNPTDIRLATNLAYYQG